MKLKAMSLAVSTAAAAFAFAAPASAQISGDVIKIGFITDISGVYSDIDGQGGAEAIKFAIADMGGSINGKKIELVVADHQNKADVAASKSREWFDQQGVDVLIGGTNSGTALAMAKVANEKKKVFIENGAGSARLTNEECSPYTVHYAYDTVALAKGTGSAVVKQGGKSWFFLTADYAFGHSLESDTSNVVKASGGTVVGSVKHPLGASDFSSFLLQAQTSKAQIIGLANAGGDFINSVKAANEFGITKTAKLAGLLVFINDVHSLTPKLTQGMYLTDSWYWDTNDETRKFAKRYFEKQKKMPSSLQAADYSSALQYLQAVKAAGSDDADKVMAQLRKTKFNDVFQKNGYLRADGRVVHDMYLYQVKTPAESKYPWDYYKLVQTIPAEQAWTTKAESKCSAWK
ncbi:MULTISPECIES: ABC transporter substrate-binding protein [unclassified Herbaspirillum]|uniref:ABC transporter substrate-binding protein n=1 Tax=unclassified Herbaspirillum TaxID=2624150 RepID=UPI000E2EF33D|nr:MULTISPECIES: ABC transporter substrate-binding protein [unclassified Herbaspirillum]RFB67397.1 ABC transporter substrate-binding protein [Herbaspirillum sp. 3R-3a1]TFI05004.1 ABC transporter substrate-binding protein [Herbaspirillum sp. 3R11]TFI12665.1 ABC transporter substrate-binding protein [Herbaspirillum sp. 3R-11]TFI27972.1 ABC transporter substrate-binding protein [Herbaspirillum sp. 3C11]